MDAGLLILALSAAGYLFLALFPHTRYRRNRWSGYHLLFLSFISGVALTLTGALLCFLLDQKLFERHPAWLVWAKVNVWDSALLFFFNDNKIHAQSYSRHLAFIFSGFTLAVLLPLITGGWLLIRHGGGLTVHYGAWLMARREGRLLIRRLIKSWNALQIEIAQKAAQRRGDFIEAELAEALETESASKTSPSDGRMVELLLENDMIYAGFVIESGVTAAVEDTSVRLQLVYSGYWDKDAKSLVMMRDDGEELEERGLEERSVITVPVRRIVSVEIIKLASNS